MTEADEEIANAVMQAHINKYARQGSDPLISTARGKLQSKRSKVNDEINRELRMRSGAENLFKATDNKRLKELVAVELLFFNSNIQLLKEELSDLNSSVSIYQHDSVSHPPMIPLGLKETKDVDFTLAVKDFIGEHYSEDTDKYNTELQDLHELRLAIRTPQRNDTGLELLMEYYNQVYFLEKRFFPPERSVSLHFHWYDSLTGVPNTQKTLTFEKGCVLFNIGALYTQLACKQDRNSLEGLQNAIRRFELAGGAFRYLHNHFSHAPSIDMQPNTLTMLIQLMMSQAQECVYEIISLDGIVEGMLEYFNAAQEAMTVSQMYQDTYQLMSSKQLKDYLPFSWLSMAQVKGEYYKALAHHHIAEALLDQPDSLDETKIVKMVAGLHWLEEGGDEEVPVTVPKSFDDRKQLAKAHLRESLISHEEALHVHDLCKQLRKIDTFQGILKIAHERSVSSFSLLEEEDDFTEIYAAPKINPHTRHVVVPSKPEFSKIKVLEIFNKLGPISIFNARNQWTVPRTVSLDRTADQGYGFSVRGDSPVKVADIEPGSIAEMGNMRVGDLLFAVGDQDTRWAKHDGVVNLVRKSGLHLELKLITPLNKDCFDPPVTPSAPSTPGTPMRMQGSLSGVSSKSSKSRLSAPWIFVRKGSKDKEEKMDGPLRSKEEEEELDMFHM